MAQATEKKEPARWSMFHPDLNAALAEDGSIGFPDLPRAHMVYCRVHPCLLALKPHHILVVSEVAKSNWFFVLQAEADWFNQAFLAKGAGVLSEDAEHFWNVRGRLPMAPVAVGENEVMRRLIHLRFFCYRKSGLGLGSAEDCAQALVERLPSTFDDWLRRQTAPETLPDLVYTAPPELFDRETAAVLTLHDHSVA